MTIKSPTKHIHLNRFFVKNPFIMAPCLDPSFFKVLMNASAPHLALPPDFMSLQLNNEILSDIIIQSAKGGYSWRLKIKRIRKLYCFTNGWNKMAKDSTFKMVMYRPNKCENVLPPQTKVEDDEDIVVDDDKAYDYD